MAEDQEIKSIERNYGKTIKVKLTTWKDTQYVDVREYYNGDDDEELPTKKGVRFPIDCLDEFIEAFNEIKKQQEEVE